MCNLFNVLDEITRPRVIQGSLIIRFDGSFIIRSGAMWSIMLFKVCEKSV